jgi:hypothetical protein
LLHLPLQRVLLRALFHSLATFQSACPSLTTSLLLLLLPRVPFLLLLSWYCQMRSSSRIDPTLRFQTHNSLPTELNTYAPHTELLSSFSLLGSAGAAAPATFTSAYDFSPASMRSSSGGAVVAAAVASSSPTCQLDSAVHHWYKQLAAQYASSSSGSKLRFLSLQADAPRAKALCRRLGVGAPLSVLLVEPGSGRQVLQVVGTKVEQELPSGEHSCCW